MDLEFQAFPKMARLMRDVIVTEKIDGTNAQILITDDGRIQAGSRTRWITPEDDNFGFARWVAEHKEELLALGPGRHFGEWWGKGIQRGYGLAEKRFSLFNVSRWVDPRDCKGEITEGRTAVPECCTVVPVLLQGLFNTAAVDACVEFLQERGSQAAPGFMQPEGVVVFHTAGLVGFKRTLEKDDQPKGLTT